MLVRFFFAFFTVSSFGYGDVVPSSGGGIPATVLDEYGTFCTSNLDCDATTPAVNVTQCPNLLLLKEPDLLQKKQCGDVPSTSCKCVLITEDSPIGNCRITHQTGCSWVHFGPPNFDDWRCWAPGKASVPCYAPLP